MVVIRRRIQYINPHALSITYGSAYKSVTGILCLLSSYE